MEAQDRFYLYISKNRIYLLNQLQVSIEAGQLNTIINNELFEITLSYLYEYIKKNGFIQKETQTNYRAFFMMSLKNRIRQHYLKNNNFGFINRVDYNNIELFQEEDEQTIEKQQAHEKIIIILNDLLEDKDEIYKGLFFNFFRSGKGEPELKKEFRKIINQAKKIYLNLYPN